MMSTDAAVNLRTAPACRVSAGTHAGTTVLHLQGDLVAATAGGLRRELAQAVGETAVLLDMTGVAFVDAVGLGVIMGVVRRIREQGGRVAIAGADPRRGVGRALETAGADRLVRTTDSPSRALEWLTSPVSPEFDPPGPSRPGTGGPDRLLPGTGGIGAIE